VASARAPGEPVEPTSVLNRGRINLHGQSIAACRGRRFTYHPPVSTERIYRCATTAAMARRAVNDEFNAYTVAQFALSEDPDEVLVEVDTNGQISPVTQKQVARISVIPHHPKSQDVAERIWERIDWSDLEGDDWVDPAEVDVEARGWDCRMKIYY
jgi:hypothetical protein